MTIAAAVILIAALPGAADVSAARRIAIATVRPPRTLADALAQFDRQFDAGYARAGGGTATTAVQKRRLSRMRAAGRAEMSRQLTTDAIPRLLTLTERDYRANFTPAELARIAAFWTSPAGEALVQAMPRAAGQGGTLTLPPEHRDTITTYLTSPEARKESARSATLRGEMATVMTAFLQRAQPKITARIAAAGKTGTTP
ncbi:hypothetical protein ASG29_09460 [Sphingomonas sp. Leaf412]|uniref:DUF2059 domain-containing protein n=1 Tax=Sphingomonas sp. Leaf412 TaxID=1736370 RepID=UPI0006FE8D51|nr:DUF2059 domain-containing protein [Sphingomonas sp. Leaf412]KQT32067.1 hypothetical protein ASG29_09460 [Sphingomonas sp. Leaf412]